MSHVVQIELEIHDLDALERAAARLGLVLTRGQQSYRWYGYSVGDSPLPAGFEKTDLGHCQHAISIPGDNRAYEIGVCQRRDGKEGYTLLWDFWNGGYGLQDKVGEDANLLTQAYATEVTINEYQSLGYYVTESLTEDGEIVLNASK
jgi:hypothetical protein